MARALRRLGRMLRLGQSANRGAAPPPPILGLLTESGSVMLTEAGSTILME